MARAKRCDRCGVFYEGNVNYKYEDFVVNSFRIGNWDQKHKVWRSIASGYDICERCGREITECIMGGENNNIQMHAVELPQKGGKKALALVASEVEAVSDESGFEKTVEEGDDGAE